MAMQQKQEMCKTCNRMRLFQAPGTNHVLHLLITIVLFVISAPFFGALGFLWILTWIGMSRSKGVFRCTQCGEKYKQSLGSQAKDLVAVIVTALLIIGFFAIMSR